MNYSRTAILIILTTLHSVNLNAQVNNPEQSVVDINNITSWVSSSGYHDWAIVGGYWNGAFPNGYDVGMVFGEGITWGGIVDDGNVETVRVNGNTYR